MSERIKSNSEHLPDNETEKNEKQAPSPQKTEAKNHKHEHQEQINKIRQTIEKSSKSSEDISKANKDNEPKQKHRPTNVAIGDQLQAQALKKQLRTIQEKLPPAQKQFSRFIHNPTIEKISDGASATIARPSGLLFAGVFSFITSIIVMSISRYYGYEYNYLVGLVSLAGGFVAGLILEALFKLFKKVKSN